MLTLLLFIVFSLIFVITVLLLSSIKSTVARALSLFIFLIMFLSLFTFLIYRVSGERNIIDGFDKLGNTIINTYGESNLPELDEIQDITKNAPTTTNTTIPTAISTPTAIPVPTATPIPALPPNNTGKTTDEMLTYFIEVAIYDDDEDVLTRRWEVPIEVEIKGNYTTKDYDFIVDQMELLNDLEMLPPISIVDMDGNFIIQFTKQKNISDFNLESNFDGDYFADYEINANNQFSEAICVIASDTINQTGRNYAVLSSIIYGVGISGWSDKYEESILQSDWTDMQSFSAIDYYMIQLLYSGRIKTGMNREEIEANIR